MSYKANDCNVFAENTNIKTLELFIDAIEYFVRMNVDKYYYGRDDARVKYTWCEKMRNAIKYATLTKKDRRGIVLEYLIIEARNWQGCTTGEEEKPNLGYIDYSEL